VVWEAGAQEVQAHAPKFWFVENLGKTSQIWVKFLNIWAKMAPNIQGSPSRCRAQCKTWAQGPMQNLGAGPF